MLALHWFNTTLNYPVLDKDDNIVTNAANAAKKWQFYLPL